MNPDTALDLALDAGHTDEAFMLVSDANLVIEHLEAQVDALVLASQCWRGNLELSREVLEITVPREVVGPLYAEVIARLEAVESHIDTTVAGVRAATSPLALAGEGSEPEARVEGSRSAPRDVDAASTLAPSDSRPRPQRILEALEAVTS